MDVFVEKGMAICKAEMILPSDPLIVFEMIEFKTLGVPGCSYTQATMWVSMTSQMALNEY